VKKYRPFLSQNPIGGTGEAHKSAACAVTLLDRAAISDEERDKIYWRNALRVFHLS
jgi:predicted TIM-barrel fold metal-dependent hydrolase